MSTLTISLSDEQLKRLQENASLLGTTPEELARAGIEEFLKRPDEAFRNAMEYVLRKNAELYKRLA